VVTLLIHLYGLYMLYNALTTLQGKRPYKSNSYIENTGKKLLNYMPSVFE